MEYCHTAQCALNLYYFIKIVCETLFTLFEKYSISRGVTSCRNGSKCPVLWLANFSAPCLFDTRDDKRCDRAVYHWTRVRRNGNNTTTKIATVCFSVVLLLAYLLNSCFYCRVTSQKCKYQEYFEKHLLETALQQHKNNKRMSTELSESDRLDGMDSDNWRQ